MSFRGPLQHMQFWYNSFRHRVSLNAPVKPTIDAGLSQCTLFPSSLLPKLRSDPDWARFTSIGFNWNRAPDQHRHWHASQYHDLLQRLPKDSCPAVPPEAPWTDHLATACPSRPTPAGDEFTALCRTWLNVPTAGQYRITLEVDAPNADVAAWAAVTTRDPAGRYAGAAYLSAGGLPASKADDGDYRNRWSVATVLLGGAASPAGAQAGYYVSSVITGRGAADVAAVEVVLRRWRVSVQALAEVPGRGAIGCGVHAVDFLQGVASPVKLTGRCIAMGCLLVIGPPLLGTAGWSCTSVYRPRVIL